MTFVFNVRALCAIKQLQVGKKITARVELKHRIVSEVCQIKAYGNIMSACFRSLARLIEKI